MKKGLLIFLLFMILKKLVFGGEFEVDENTLFLLHYNHTLDADYSVGDRKLKKGHASLTSNNEGHFGEGLLVKPGLCSNPDGLEMVFTYPTYYAKDNINLSKGTIECWVKFITIQEEKDYDPDSVLISLIKWKGGMATSSFRIGVGTGKGKTKWVYLQKIEKEENGLKIDNIIFPVLWHAGEWHHLAVTWDADKNFVELFIDGKKVKKGSFEKTGSGLIVKECDEITIGGKHSVVVYSQYISPPLSVFVIDEVRISDIIRYTEDFAVK